jgi:hypothetical protein
LNYYYETGVFYVLLLILYNVYLLSVGAIVAVVTASSEGIQDAAPIPVPKPPEGRAVRRSCRTDASLGGTGSTVAIANNNNDPGPKDLNSRILLSQSHSKKVLLDI